MGGGAALIPPGEEGVSRSCRHHPCPCAAASTTLGPGSTPSYRTLPYYLDDQRDIAEAWRVTSGFMKDIKAPPHPLPLDPSAGGSQLPRVRAFKQP